MDKVKIIFLLCTLAAIEIKSELIKGKITKVVVTCDNFENITDFKNCKSVEFLQNKLFYDLWNITIPKRTDSSYELKCILEDMLLKSDVPFWRRYALAISEWIFAYLPVLSDVPHLCSYAQLINATAEHLKNKNCPLILKAVEASTAAFTETGNLLSENGIKFVGCPHCTRPVKLCPATCPHKGLVYDLDEIWGLVGWKYPCRLRAVVRKMYYSDSVSDRVMALFATVFLSQQFSIMEKEYDPELLYKLFVMYTYKKIERYCCDDFTHEARDLSAKIQDFNIVVFDLARKSTGCAGH